MEATLQQIRDMVSSASLATEVQRSLLWGLDQLPPLYRDLERTYDVRYRDGIQGQVQAMIAKLGAGPTGCPDATRVMMAIIEQLQAMHQRLGIPGLGLKLPPPAKPVRKRKAI